MSRNYTSTLKIESKLPEWAGVTFTVRKLTEGMRTALLEGLADVRAKISDVMGEAQAIGDSADAAANAKLRVLMDKLNIHRAAVDHGYVKAGLVKVDGLDIDDAPATVASLIESGPAELYGEILAAVKHEAGLTEQERKNSESPIISDVPEGGQTSASTVPSADATATT